MLEVLIRDVALLENKARFVKELSQGNLKLSGKSKQEIGEELAQ